jgi:hypothetical protein
MPKTGPLKIAPKNMRRNELQFCIDGVLIDEVLDLIPKGVTILGASVIVGKGYNKQRVVVPTKLKKLGVQSMRQTLPEQEASIVFDQVKPETIKSNVKVVADLLGTEYASAYFKYMVLSNGSGSGKFERTTKQMNSDDKDLRRKKKVLALTWGQARVQSLLADINAEKYRCSIEEVVIRTVVCSK